MRRSGGAAVSMSFDRCRLGTDRGQAPGQKGAISSKARALESVCRELPAWRWPHQEPACIVRPGFVACDRSSHPDFGAFKKEQRLPSKVGPQGCVSGFNVEIAPW